MCSSSFYELQRSRTTAPLIWSRTTSMPLSSDAFSSSVIDEYRSPYIFLAHAIIVDVLPVTEADATDTIRAMR